MDRERLKEIWSQKTIPVVGRRNDNGYKLRVRLPWAQDNRQWLNSLGKSAVVWNKPDERWELPKSWFNTFVNRALDRYGKLYVIQPYREHEKCAPSCMKAEGHECNCSCMGKNHGAGFHSSWFEVSDTFAVRWGEEQIACRLMVRTNKTLLEQYIEALRA